MDEGKNESMPLALLVPALRITWELTFHRHFVGSPHGDLASSCGHFLPLDATNKVPLCEEARWSWRASGMGAAIQYDVGSE